MCSVAGGVSQKRVRIRRSQLTTQSIEDVASVIKPAGESSKTDPAEFIEQQQRLLDEIKSSKPLIVVLPDDERTDRATKSNFDEQHFRNTPPHSPFTTEKLSIFNNFPHDVYIDKKDDESTRSGMLNTSKG